MKLETLIHKYLVYCEMQKGLDTKTLKAYRIDLRQFTEFTGSEENFYQKDVVCDFIESMHIK